MPPALHVELKPEQIAELEQARDHHAKAYLREAAAAILKVAQGESVRQVALHGLLKVRDPESVSSWIRRYHKHGLSGLEVASGRGRKPIFFPSQPGRSAPAGADHDRS